MTCGRCKVRRIPRTPNDERAPNPRDEKFHQMCLYNVDDLKDLALKVHGSPEKLAEKMAIRAGGSPNVRARFLASGSRGKKPGSKSSRLGFSPGGNSWRSQYHKELAADIKREAEEAAAEAAKRAEEEADGLGPCDCDDFDQCHACDMRSRD